MGSGTTEVALVKYSTYTVKEAGKPRTYNQLEVKDVDWDDSLGSNLLDMALARHFASEFSSREAARPGGAAVDVLSLPKSMAKLRRQVRRTKEMLSANSAAPCSVEELYDGRDFQSSISREAFEGLAADFFGRATAPLRRLLERNGLAAGDIDAVELLGGGSRVPRLQAALSEVLGGRGLDRHLDADEAAVLGAGLFAANLSTSFRLRKFGMVDVSMYGVSLSLDNVVLGAAEEAGEAVREEEPPLLKLRNLLPYMKKLPSKRLVKLERLAADPLRFSLAYNGSTPHGLPPGVREAALAEWEVTGVDEVVGRYNSSGQVTLRFDADYSGLLRLDRVEAVVEYEVMEEREVEEAVEAGAGGEQQEKQQQDSAEGGKAEQEADKDKGSNAGESEAEEENGSGGEGGGEGEGSEAAQPGSEEAVKTEEGASNTTATANTTTNTTATTIKRRILVPKTKVAKVPLSVGGRGWLSPPLTADQLAASRAVLAGWEEAEAVKREVARARNDLESYIIAMKEALETDELVMKVSTEAQRESFHSRLAAEEDWLYMEAEEGEGPEQFRRRLKALQEIGEPIKRRAEELELRPKLVEGLRSQAGLRRALIGAWPATKPWISEAEQQEVDKLLSDFEADLAAKLAAQEGRPEHEEPAFTASELAAAWERFEKAFNKVNNKKKPKPPPEEAKPAAEGAGAEGAEGAGKGAESGSEGDKAGEADPGAAAGAKDANGG
ncbi:hypothetical protein Agub_g3033, partial [Astrephomene gubernaculifera]